MPPFYGASFSDVLLVALHGAEVIWFLNEICCEVFGVSK